MITEIYDALVEANISEGSARKVTLAIEKNIIDNSSKLRQKLLMEKIIPIEKENIGIRAEIKFLGEKMEYGFSETEKRMQMINDQMKFGFAETEKRMQMINDQMKFGFAETEKRIQITNEKMEFGFAELRSEIKSIHEIIKITNDQMNKRFAYIEKLQISMLGCIIGLLAKLVFFS